MSISFSGLASGLDTSSWVESLTALKRAKVETYQEEKKNLLSIQDTLTKIKSFFTQFRSVIEKVTDTKFGVGSLDVFSQNVALSSKANILTATATGKAQEGSYTINVSSLASSTQASSGFSKVTTQTVSATATLGSTLESIGVKAGRIGVTVNGIERSVRIGNDETIQSFIDKMNNVGAKSSYNEKTGVFNINVSTNDIRDIDNTGIVNALHLKGVNEGYTTNVLQTSKMETFYEKVDLNTKLEAIGVNNGSIILNNPNGSVLNNTLFISPSMTFGDLIDSFKNKWGIEARLTSDGRFEIDTEYTIDDNGSGLIEALGWEDPEITSSSQQSKPLNYQTTVVEGTVASRNTLLKDLGSGINVKNGDTIIVKNNNSKTSTITLSNTSTIGSVLDGLNNAGLFANIDSKGVVSISNGNIVGGSFDIEAAFNLQKNSSSTSATSDVLYAFKDVAQDINSTTQVSFTGVRTATETDLISDFVDFSSTANGNTLYLKVENSVGVTTSTIRVNNTTTFQELFDHLRTNGIDAAMNDGVINLKNLSDCFIDGTKGLGSLLGIGVASNEASSTVTSAVTKTSGVLTYTQNVVATGSSNIGDYIACTQQVSMTMPMMTISNASIGKIIDANGLINEIFTSATGDYSHKDNYVKTFDDLKNKLAEFGISMSMNNGVIELSSSNGAYVEGNLFDQMGIAKKFVNKTVTVGTSMTSTGKVTFTETVVTQGTTNTVRVQNSITSNQLSVKTSNTTSTSTTTFNGSSTLAQAFGAIGTSGTLEITEKVYQHSIIDDSDNLAVSGSTNIGDDFMEPPSITYTYNVTYSSSITVDELINAISEQTYGNVNASLFNNEGIILRTTSSGVVAATDSNLGVSNSSLIKFKTSTSSQYTMKPLTTSANWENLTLGDLDKFLMRDATIGIGEIPHYIKLASPDGQQTYTISVNSSTTLGDISNSLSTYGIALRCNVSGQLNISESPAEHTLYGHCVITEISSNVAKRLGLTDKIGEGKSYSYSVQTQSTTTVATKTLTEDTTLLNLGLSSTQYIYVGHGGPLTTLTLSTIDTIGTLIDKLGEHGITASIQDGQFSIAPSSTGYIDTISYQLQSALKLPSNGACKTTVTSAATNTASKALTRKDTATASSTNLLKDIGQSGNKTITVSYNGNSSSLVLSDTMKIEDAVSQINNQFGYMGLYATFSNGQVSIASSNNNTYVTEFGGAFGITGKGYTTNVNTSGKKYNTSSDKIQKNQTVVANWDTRLSELGYTLDGEAISVYDENGNFTQVIIDKNDTLRDVREKLAMYDIAFNCANGSITISGTKGAYVANVTTSLQSALKLDSKQGYNYELAPISNDDNPLMKEVICNNSPCDGIVDFDIYKDGKLIGSYYADFIDGTVTLQDFLHDAFEQYGINATITSDGRLKLTANGDYSIVTNNYDILPSMGLGSDNWIVKNSYQSSAPLGSDLSNIFFPPADRNTELSALGVTTGEYLLYKDVVKHTLFVSSDDTIGSLIDTLRSYGIESSLVNDNTGLGTIFSIHYDGDAYLAQSSSSGKSNIVEQLFGTKEPKRGCTYSGTPQVEGTLHIPVTAAEDTKINNIFKFGDIPKTDSIDVTIDGETVKINVDEDETIGSLLDKFQSLGIEASFNDGQIVLQSGFKSLSLEKNQAGSLDRLGLTYSNDLGGFSASSQEVKSTEVTVTESNNSAAKFADYSTKLSDLNISTGTLSIYVDGIKSTIHIEENDTLGDLNKKIRNATDNKVLAGIEQNNGHLIIHPIPLTSNTWRAKEVVVGSTTDTSNFVAITGMQERVSETGSGITSSLSSRPLYKVNGNSKVTESDLFVRGNVTTGTFKVGNATIEIDENTTLNDIISQINYSEDSNATAYWDSVLGRFTIKSKTTGASIINIEAGTSNFTEIMGLTEANGALNTSAQTLGSNAVFTINGTRFTSTSNTITSDISRIEGVTINLKDITTDEPVTLTIEKDKEVAADAMQEVVDAYNNLIDNIDKEVARGANLSSETTLRFIRNQIRSLMTGSIASAGNFKNLSQVGISLAAATSGNIRTDNINTLSFDKDKFINAFASDTNSLKALLVGSDEKKGILTQVENVLEQALGGVTGYFASAEKSYANKISKLDDKITKTNKAADRYKARLEAKFKAMDMIISKFQNQYSSFLGS